MFDISRRFRGKVNDCHSSTDNCEKMEAILKRVLATFFVISLAVFLFFLPHLRRRISIYDPITAKIKIKTFFFKHCWWKLYGWFSPRQTPAFAKRACQFGGAGHFASHSNLSPSFCFQCYCVTLIQDFPPKAVIPRRLNSISVDQKIVRLMLDEEHTARMKQHSEQAPQNNARKSQRISSFQTFLRQEDDDGRLENEIKDKLEWLLDARVPQESR